MDLVAELKQEVKDLKSRNETLNSLTVTQAAKIQQLQQELMLALHRMWGRSSEKFEPQGPLLFDELEDQPPPEQQPATQDKTEKTETRGRKPLSSRLPRVDHFHDLEESDKQCTCGHQLTKIGEDVNEKLNIVPARVWVDRHHRAKYACRHCQGLVDETKPAVQTAAGVLDLIPRSIVTAGLLAHIWTAKFCDHLPFHRQEAGFARIEAQVSRQDMVNWTMKITTQLEPLIGLIEQSIRDGPVVQMDETPVTVLKLDHSGQSGQGWMWLARGRKAVRYRFAPGRGNEHAKAFLGDFEGYFQSDGHSAYDVVTRSSQIIHVGCWAHARRKFMDAEKVAPSNLTKDALGRIRKLYELERQCRNEAKNENLTEQAFLGRRKALLGPYLVGLRVWIDRTAAETLPSGKAGQALAYTVGQWDKLVRFLDHPWLTPDNNGAENAIRPFVVGRKNWLFHGNDAGAEASCVVYTLIETAKMNGLEPYAYLRQLLEKLPAVRLSGDWDSLLPWNITPGEK
jgi:transposase